MNIYIGETAVKITMDVGADITGASVVIKYKKPSGTTGSWSGTITDAANGIYEYDVITGDFKEGDGGKWLVWSYVVFANSKIGIGDPRPLYVLKEGTPKK